jgi:hypothetical protein
MNTQPLNVMPMRQVASRPAGMQPKVLNVELVGKLELMNRMVRWLREHNQVPTSINAYGMRPTITVDNTAAACLVKAGHGVNFDRLADGDYLGSVVLNGCSVQWRCHGIDGR